MMSKERLEEFQPSIDPGLEAVRSAAAESLKHYQPAFPFGNERDARIIAKSAGRLESRAAESSQPTGGRHYPAGYDPSRFANPEDYDALYEERTDMVFLGAEEVSRDEYPLLAKRHLELGHLVEPLVLKHKNGITESLFIAVFNRPPKVESAETEVDERPGSEATEGQDG